MEAGGIEPPQDSIAFRRGRARCDRVRWPESVRLASLVARSTEEKARRRTGRRACVSVRRWWMNDQCGAVRAMSNALAHASEREDTVHAARAEDQKVGQNGAVP